MVYTVVSVKAGGGTPTTDNSESPILNVLLL